MAIVCMWWCEWFVERVDVVCLQDVGSDGWYQAHIAGLPVMVMDDGWGGSVGGLLAGRWPRTPRKPARCSRQRYTTACAICSEVVTEQVAQCNC
jgi:hypothetical protein